MQPVTNGFRNETKSLLIYRNTFQEINPGYVDEREARFGHATVKGARIKPPPLFPPRSLVWFTAFLKNGLLSCYMFQNQKLNSDHTPF